MKKGFILLGAPILCLIVVVIGMLCINGVNTDAMKFKNEYEEYNGKKNSQDKEYKKLNISTNNPIKYSDYDEILNIINKDSGIIYLGFPNCPWCRNAVPVLFDVVRDNSVDTVYYMNIYSERDSYSIEDGKVVYSYDEEGNEIKGTKGYLKLLEVLDEYLSDYTLELDGKTYNTNVKRIYAPTVIFVKDGEVLGLHVSTVVDQTDPYKNLTEDEYDELYSIYEEFILEMKSDTCPIDSSC